ncbi:MAG: tRNA lysidine(34) synthetase TilS [Bacteroidota bacterium]
MSELSPLAQRTKAFIEREQLFAPGDGLYLAISGGVDSTVLLYLLLELGYQPQLLHFNYQLRAEASEKDADFVQNLAKKNNLNFFLKKVDTGAELNRLKKENTKGDKPSLQSLARNLRYQWFTDLQQENPNSYFLTAHHLDDALETFLINFLRGTGLAGLGGIAPKRDFYRRPLLEISRQDILEYAQEHGISWREDASNQSNDYLRNQLRHQVMGELRALQSGLNKRAVENFRQLRSSYQIYHEAVQEKWQQITQTDERGWLLVDRQKLSVWPADTQTTLLHEGLSEMGFTPEQKRQLISAKKSSLIKADQYWALITEKQLIISPAVVENEIIISLKEGNYAIDKYWTLSLQKIKRPQSLKCTANVAYFSPDLADLQLRVRHWQEGDKFRPFGLAGKRQKLQDFFVNGGVNRLERAHAWLLIDQEDQILWVMGYRTAEDYAVRPNEQEVWRAILTFNRQAK